MMSPNNLSSLPRFPLSVILSYLQQPSNQNKNPPTPLPHNKNAISFLLTTKRLAYAILPLFRVPKQVCRHYQHQREDGTLIVVVEKYRFIVLPIQDPRTLLDRLNTRRLRGRIVVVKQLKKQEQHLKVCEDVEKEVGIEINCTRSDANQNVTNTQQELYCSCYQYGRTIEELAFEEWTMMEIDHSDCEPNSNGHDNGKSSQWRIWPAHLELLRFLDTDDFGNVQEQLRSGTMKTKQKIPIPLPFCFRGPSSKHLTDSIEVPLANVNLTGGRVFGDGISLLASYPRSGNTLLRTLLERMTSIVTGSDTRPDRTLSRSLAMEHDLVGEGLVGKNSQTIAKAKSTLQLQNLYSSAQDPLVHIVKTHFPERKGWKPVKGNRVLLLVRNPYDAIDSYWNLCCTNTHTRSLDESVYTKYSQKFEGLARHEIEIWCDFHYHWIDICEKEGVPLLVARYEDLVLDTESEMLRIMKFLMSDMEDDEFASFWEWRIHHAIGKMTKKTTTEKALTQSTPTTGKNSKGSTNTSNLGSYQPRSSSGGLLSIGKSIRKKRYSESVLLHMHDIAVSLELARKQNSNKLFPVTKTDKQQPNQTLLQQFGYDIFTQKFPDNFTHPPAIASYDGSGKRKGTVVINKTPEIRDKNDPFGRPMTFWRRGETDGDTKPFPTIAR